MIDMLGDDKNLNIGSKNMTVGENRQEFIFAFNPINGMPFWATQMDIIGLMSIGGNLHTYMSNHPILLTNSNLADPHAFACEMSLNNFKDALFTGEALRFKDTVMALVENTKNLIKGGPLLSNIYVSYFLDSDADIYVNCMVENLSVIKFGVKLK